MLATQSWFMLKFGNKWKIKLLINNVINNVIDYVVPWSQQQQQFNFCWYFVINQTIWQTKTLTWWWTLPPRALLLTWLQWPHSFLKLWVVSVCACLFSYLADISYSRSWLISQPLHSCYRGFTEVWRLSIHHLHYHDTHWPNVHLVHHHTVKSCNWSYSTDCHCWHLCYMTEIATVNQWHWIWMCASLPQCHMAIWRWPQEPSNRVSPPETSS